MSSPAPRPPPKQGSVQTRKQAGPGSTPRPGCAPTQTAARGPPDELASFCLHAITAAGSLPSKTAVRRLVTVTLAGLRRSR
jgi:hypothetical protein